MPFSLIALGDLTVLAAKGDELASKRWRPGPAKRGANGGAHRDQPVLLAGGDLP